MPVVGAALWFVIDRRSVHRKLPAAVHEALEHATQFELIALDPEPIFRKAVVIGSFRDRRIPETKPIEDPWKVGFHGYHILGATVISDVGVRRQLVSALHEGVRQWDRKQGKWGFDPRHALRLVHDGKTIDLLINFECESAWIYLEDQSLGLFCTTGSPQPIFDQVLRDAGVPLRPPADH
jgi:hypothetical protein